jgi:hypothetical protein
MRIIGPSEFVTQNIHIHHITYNRILPMNIPEVNQMIKAVGSIENNPISLNNSSETFIPHSYTAR